MLACLSNQLGIDKPHEVNSYLNMIQWQAKKAVASRTAAAKEYGILLQRRIWNVEPFCTVYEWR